MKLRDLFPLATRALLVNKGRSSLTMLGITIGVTSVILMLAVGQAAERFLLYQVASFGSDLVYVMNGKGDEEHGGPPNTIDKQTLTVQDYRRIRSFEWTKGVSVNVIMNERMAHESESRNAQLVGTAEDEAQMYSMSVAKGRFFSREDVEAHRRIAALGSTVAKRLFGESDPVGQSMKIGTYQFRVIGVMDVAGTRFFSDLDNQAYIPYTTFLDAYNKNRLFIISLKAGDTPVYVAKERVRMALRDTHRIDNPNNLLSKDDFKVLSQEDAMKNIGIIGTILQILLGSVAGISLIVAGIGIMNIMYVTVTERTREIGLRKAIGATSRDVLGQFLAESVFLTVTAGIAGIILGLMFSWLAIMIILQFQAGWTFAIPWSGIALAFGVSAGIGIIFGYFPARRAASLQPVDSLRYE